MKRYIRLDGQKLVSIGLSAALFAAFERLMFWVDVIAIGSAIAGLFGGHVIDVPKASHQIAEIAREAPHDNIVPNTDSSTTWSTTNWSTTPMIGTSTSTRIGGGGTSMVVSGGRDNTR